MKRILAILAVVSLFVSCKSKAVLVEKTKAVAEDTMSASSIIARHYQVAKNFKTIYISAGARYEDDHQTQNVSADVRIKKDEKILVSVKFLGITMAKALLTPSEVKYYAKPDSEYFEGDYAMLGKWLGTDLDFQKVQNLFIGEAMDDLTKGEYAVSVDGKNYLLQQLVGSTQKEFWFEPGRLMVKKQRISQPNQARSIHVSYPNHSQYPTMILPTGLDIKAQQEKGRADIKIEYKSAAFDQDLSFPYSVPEGYERIFIK